MIKIIKGKMHNRLCAKQLHLKYFREPLFSENVGILAFLKISHFPFWFPTLKGSIREWEGNGKNPFPKFGNGKGIKKKHSRNSGTGREWKNPFPKFGKGNQRLSFLGMDGNGNSRSPLLYTFTFFVASRWIT